MSANQQVEVSDETRQITDNIVKSTKSETIVIQAKPQKIVIRCHFCSHPSPVLENPEFTLKLKSGYIASFCNEDELNEFKKQYDY